MTTTLFQRGNIALLLDDSTALAKGKVEPRLKFVGISQSDLAWRKEFSEHGWKWSSPNKAHCRKPTVNALLNARSIIQKFFENADFSAIDACKDRMRSAKFADEAAMPPESPQKNFVAEAAETQSVSESPTSDSGESRGVQARTARPENAGTPARQADKAAMPPEARSDGAETLTPPKVQTLSRQENFGSGAEFLDAQFFKDNNFKCENLLKRQAKFRDVSKEEVEAGFFPDFAPRLDERWLAERNFVPPIFIKSDEFCIFLAKKEGGETRTFQASVQEAAILILFFCRKRSFESGAQNEPKILAPKEGSPQFDEIVAFQQKYEFSSSPRIRAVRTLGKLFQALKAQVDKMAKLN